MRNLPILPEQASNFAMQSDALFWVLTLLTLAFTLLVGVLVLVLAALTRTALIALRLTPVLALILAALTVVALTALTIAALITL